MKPISRRKCSSRSSNTSGGRKTFRCKWQRELDYRLKKTLWAFTGNRIAVRFEYEFHDATGQWYRAHGNENWEFDELGYMKFGYASINDHLIKESERKFRWERKT